MRAGSTTRNCRLKIQYRSAPSGTILKTVEGAFVSVTSSAFVTLTVADPLPPPEDTRHVDVEIEIAAGSAGELFYMDNWIVNWASADTQFQPGDGPSTANAHFQPVWYEVQRRYGASGDWESIRATGASRHMHGPMFSETLYDYEAPRDGTVIWYRVRSWGVDLNVITHPVIYSPWAEFSLTPAEPTTGGRWVLTDIQDPTNPTSLLVDILEDGLDLVYPEDMAQYSPLGRSRDVFVSDVIRGAEFKFTFDFTDTTEYNTFVTLRETQRTLLLSRPWSGDQWYIRLGSKMGVLEMNTNPIRRLVDISATEVDVPPLT